MGAIIGLAPHTTIIGPRVHITIIGVRKSITATESQGHIPEYIYLIEKLAKWWMGKYVLKYIVSLPSIFMHSLTSLQEYKNATVLKVFYTGWLFRK